MQLVYFGDTTLKGCIVEMDEAKVMLVVAVFGPHALLYEERYIIVSFREQLCNWDVETASDILAFQMTGEEPMRLAMGYV